MPAWAVLILGSALFICAPVLVIVVEVARAVREVRDGVRDQQARDQQATERAVRDQLRPRTGQVEHVVPISAAPSYQKRPDRDRAGQGA